MTAPAGFALPAGAAAADPRFGRLHAYWLSRVSDGRLPGRAQIDPVDMPRDLLAHIALLEVVAAPAGRRYRFRLLGSEIAAIPGRDDTGRFYDETIAPALYAPIGAGLDVIVETGRPRFTTAQHAAPGREHIRIGRLGLPLATDGRHVDMILGMLLRLPALPV